MTYTARGTIIYWLVCLTANPPDECVLWPFPSVTDTGYGTMKWDGKQTKATHVALILSGRLRPSKRHQACHRCRVSMCVNQKHLYWGTPKQNSGDMVEHGTRQRGETHPGHILTAAQVREIRALKDSGLSQREIGTRYGISQGNVSRIWLRQTWRDLPDG